MTLQEVQRALSRKPNSHTEHREAVATMSDASYDLIQLSQLKDLPDIATFCPVSGQQTIYSAGGHFYKTLKGALGPTEWKLAEYYVDASGLYLVYLPCSDEFMQIAQRELDAIPRHIDDETSARDIITRELYEAHCRAVRLSGDFTAYLDLGDQADYIDAHINTKGSQSISITMVNAERRLRRFTYHQNSNRMTATYYC